MMHISRLSSLKSALLLQFIATACLWICFTNSFCFAASSKADAATETLELPHGYRASDCNYPCPFSACKPRLGDQVYLVSTRCLPGGCGRKLPVDQLSVHLFEVGQGWIETDISDLIETESPQGLTTVYVHGNRVDAAWGVRRGWEMYHEVTRCIDPEINIRFIMWSWPSDAEQQPLRTTRINGFRTNDEGYYLAHLLNQLPASERVSLSGFSFGSRVVSGALHLLGGGQLYGRKLETIAEKDHGYRVVFLAAAMSCHWLAPGQYHGLAMSRVDHLVNIYNSSDSLLKRYHVLTKNRNDRALGYVGLCCGLATGQRERVTQYNASGSIGKSHTWKTYACARCYMRIAREHLVWK